MGPRRGAFRLSARKQITLKSVRSRARDGIDQHRSRVEELGDARRLIRKGSNARVQKIASRRRPTSAVPLLRQAERRSESVEALRLAAGDLVAFHIFSYDLLFEATASRQKEVPADPM